MGIENYNFNFEKELDTLVKKLFIEQYLKGITKNQ